MKLNDVEDGDVQALMQESVPSANSSEWRCAHLVRGALACILNNAITGADVVQRKIAERVDDFVAERRWNCERSAVDQRSRAAVLERMRVWQTAQPTALKERVASDRGGGKWILPPGARVARHEVREGKHIAAVVFRIGHRIESEGQYNSDPFGRARRDSQQCPAFGSSELLPPSRRICW